MTALILALIALGTLFGLIVRAAKKAPQEYVDLMIMMIAVAIMIKILLIVSFIVLFSFICCLVRMPLATASTQ